LRVGYLKIHRTLPNRANFDRTDFLDRTLRLKLLESLVRNFGPLMRALHVVRETAELDPAKCFLENPPENTNVVLANLLHLLWSDAANLTMATTLPALFALFALLALLALLATALATPAGCPSLLQILLGGCNLLASPLLLPLSHSDDLSFLKVITSLSQNVCSFFAKRYTYSVAKSRRFLELCATMHQPKQLLIVIGGSKTSRFHPSHHMSLQSVQRDPTDSRSLLHIVNRPV
jgi:hypothetical protein